MMERDEILDKIFETDYDAPANSYEAEMVNNQVAFIKYAVDEIDEHVKSGGIFPEWFQNKLSGVHETIKMLHAYMEGERQQQERQLKLKSIMSSEDSYLETLQDKLQKMTDYHAKKKALQDIQMDPNTDKDPELKKELIKRLHRLEKTGK